MEGLSSYRSALLAVATIALALFSCFIALYKLGNEPLQTYDEATYAEVLKETSLRGNPTSLTYLNVPYFRKPPLMFWMAAPLEGGIGDEELAIRLPSALAALACIVLVILIALEAGIGLPFALLAGAFLATTAGFMEFARDARFDILVTGFILLAAYAGMRAQRDRRWFLMTGIALGLAVLSKGVIVAFAGAALVALWLASHGVSGMAHLLRDRYVWAGVGIFLLIAAPWHVAQPLEHGAAFWQSYLGDEVVRRAGGNLFPGSANPTNAQYAAYLAGRAAPWTTLFLLLLAAVPLFYARMPQAARAALVMSVATVGSVLLVMGVASTKAFGYLMPLFPFLAIGTALMLAALWKQSGELLRSAMTGALLVLLALGAYLTYYAALHVDPFYGWEIGQGHEERDIGRIIKAAENPLVYAYAYDSLGAIIYYSGLPQSENPHVLLLGGDAPVQDPSFVVTDESREVLQERFPNLRFEPRYDGRFVSLFTVSP